MANSGHWQAALLNEIAIAHNDILHHVNETPSASVSGGTPARVTAFLDRPFAGATLPSQIEQIGQRGSLHSVERFACCDTTS
jgi:hypothetical protein